VFVHTEHVSGMKGLPIRPSFNGDDPSHLQTRRWLPSSMRTRGKIRDCCCGDNWIYFLWLKIFYNCCGDTLDHYLQKDSYWTRKKTSTNSFKLQLQVCTALQKAKHVAAAIHLQIYITLPNSWLSWDLIPCRLFNCAHISLPFIHSSPYRHSNLIPHIQFIFPYVVVW
jgi:hypothetical protein